MTDEELLQRLGEDVFGWEFLETTPHPPGALDQAYDSERRPIFWFDYDRNGARRCSVVGTSRYEGWNPLENEEQRREILEKVESIGGKVSIHENRIEVRRVDGESISITGDSPKLICEAALNALSTEPLGDQ